MAEATFLPEVTADSPDIRGLADTRVVPRVVTASVVCMRDRVLRVIPLCAPLRRRPLRELSLMRHTLLRHSPPETSIISAAGMNEDMASETIGAGAMDIRTLIRT